MITLDMIEKGYDKGIVTVVGSPHEDGAVCRIGKYWFYFGGQTAEESTAEEYRKCVPREDIVNEIFTVLDDLKDDPDFLDEYLYYESFLREHGYT